MPVRYWDYWNDSTSTATTTTGSTYYNKWSPAMGTGTSTYISSALTTISVTQPVVERYVITGYEGWSDHARAVLTRLVNDETNTGFKITMWMADVEITDPGIMIRDLDWFMLRLRQVASQADYEKIAAHVAQVRAEIASGIEAPSGVETGNTDSTEGESPTGVAGDAQEAGKGGRQ